MGKYRPYIIFGIAILVALITSALIINYLQRKGKVKDISLETQPVVVAKVDMSWGTILNKEMIEMKPYLKNSLPVGYFPDLNSLVGRVLVSNIKANEPVLESRLAPSTLKTGGVAAVVSPKKRAVAVKVDKVIGVAGFINPGNRVDVLVTLHPEKAQSPVTKTVLENILVLASGPEIQTKGKEEKPSAVDVITLEVTPEEAEKLGLAATQGKILLTLRNFSDSEDVTTKGMTIPALLASYSGPVKETKDVTGKEGSKKLVPKKEIKPQPAPGKKPPFVVELIKGSKVSEVKFERSE